MERKFHPLSPDFDPTLLLTLFKLCNTLLKGIESLVDVLVVALGLFAEVLPLLLQQSYLLFQLSLQILHRPARLAHHYAPQCAHSMLSVVHYCRAYFQLRKNYARSHYCKT